MNDEPGSERPGDAEPAAEVALRQLRRRYDELRGDYEALLLRLTDIEERADAEEPPPSFGILDHLLAPLQALRDEYADALAGMGRVVLDLEELLARGMKGQREPSRTEPGSRIEVDVRGRSPGELLAFREQLAGLPGVARVSIHAIDGGSAVLIVELA